MEVVTGYGPDRGFWLDTIQSLGQGDGKMEVHFVVIHWAKHLWPMYSPVSMLQFKLSLFLKVKHRWTTSSKFILLMETQPRIAKPFHVPCKFQWIGFDTFTDIFTKTIRMKSRLKQECPEYLVFCSGKGDLRTSVSVVNNMSYFN